MTIQFVGSETYQLDLRGDQALLNMGFGVVHTIEERRIEFVFAWNGKGQFYSLEVEGPDGHIIKFYPRPYEAYVIRDFHPDGGTKRDAMIMFRELDMSYEELTPQSMKMFLCEVHVGKVVRFDG